MAALFDSPDRGRGHRRRRWLAASAIAVVAVALAATGFAAASASASDPGRYRTATVSTHDVDAVLTGVATIEPVSQAAVAFPVGGTVATVSVALGDTVTSGQQLATLDTTPFESTLHTQQAALASAQLKLTAALDAQSSATTVASSTAVGTGTATTVQPAAEPAATGVGGRGTPTTSAQQGPATGQQSLAAAQQALIAAQTAADAALKTADAALAGSASVCPSTPSTPGDGSPVVDGAGAATPGQNPTVSGPGTSGAAGSSTGPTTTAPTTTSAASVPTAAPTTVASSQAAGSSSATVADPLTACQQALRSVSSAQHAVDSAQRNVQTTATSLDRLLTTAAGGAASAPSSGTSTAPTSGSRAGTAVTSGTAAGTSTGASGAGSAGAGSSRAAAVPSAADLIADQQAVDAATAQVAAATQAIDQATIVSPIGGTVVSVTMAPGATVTAASSTASITVAGDGGFEVTTRVDVNHVAGIKLGRSATVLPDGSNRSLRGQIVSVSATPTQSTTSTTYLVVVGLSDPNVNLPNGATGSVSILTGTAPAALAVPTSAVTTLGTRHTVTVLTGTVTKETAVTVGVVGDRWTEIRSGLSSGQEVVLADLSAPLPTSATQVATNATGTNDRRTITLPNGQALQVPPGGFGGGR